MSEEYINHLKDNIIGYHLLGDSILNEVNWRLITDMTLKFHEKSYADKIQTKTSKLGSTIILSFYRLTNSCDSVKDIVKEIDEIRIPDKGTVYFVLLKKEDKLQYKYQFYIIPHELPMFHAKNYRWKPTYGKKGKYK